MARYGVQRFRTIKHSAALTADSPEDAQRTFSEALEMEPDTFKPKVVVDEFHVYELTEEPSKKDPETP